MKNKKVLALMLSCLMAAGCAATTFTACDWKSVIGVDKVLDANNNSDSDGELEEPSDDIEVENPSENSQSAENPSDNNQVVETPSDNNQVAENPSEDNQPAEQPSGDGEVADQPSGGENEQQPSGDGDEAGNPEGDTTDKTDGSEAEQPSNGQTDTTETIEVGTAVSFLGMTAGSSVSSLESAKTSSQTTAKAAKARAAVKADSEVSTDMYSQNRGENFYIDVQFDNKNNYKIVSFSLSYAGRKVSYSNSKFEDGSGANDIYVKAEATYNNADYTEYTISDITYIEGDTIKKVNIENNDTVKVGITDLRTNLDEDVFTPVYLSPQYEYNEATGESELVSYDRIIGYTMTNISSDYIKDGVLTIPSEYEGLPVTGIGSFAFAYSDIQEVVISETVETVEYGAFYNCKSLKRVTIGSSIKYIGTSAFYGCTAIDYVNYTGTMHDWLNIQFGLYLAAQLHYMQNYESGITDTRYRYGTMRYANPTYYAHDLHIGGELVTEVVIPEDVYMILQCAFTRCVSITKVTLHENVKSIGYYAFNTCSGISQIDLVNVEIIDSNAFNGCYGLTSITIPSTVKAINGEGSNAAFYVTQKLVEVYNLSSLNIVAGQRGNGDVALYADNVYDSTQTVNITEDNDGLLWYTKPGESDKIYLVGYNGSATEVTVPYIYEGKQVEIMRCAFAGNTIVEKVTFEEGFKELPDRVFAYCWNVEEVVLPSTIESLGDHAFWDSGIKKLTLPAACTSVGGSAFSDCENLVLTINSTEIDFGQRAFYSNKNLTVNFAGSVDTWRAATEDDFTGEYIYKGVMYYIDEYTINCNNASYSE